MRVVDRWAVVVYERDGQMEGVARLEGWPNRRVARWEKWPAKKGVDIVWEAAIDERGRKRQRWPHKGVAESESGAR
jgi:hypothetical protein